MPARVSRNTVFLVNANDVVSVVVSWLSSIALSEGRITQQHVAPAKRYTTTFLSTTLFACVLIINSRHPSRCFVAPSFVSLALHPFYCLVASHIRVNILWRLLFSQIGAFFFSLSRLSTVVSIMFNARFLTLFSCTFQCSVARNLLLLALFFLFFTLFCSTFFYLSDLTVVCAASFTFICRPRFTVFLQFVSSLFPGNEDCQQYATLFCLRQSCTHTLYLQVRLLGYCCTE